MNIDAKRHKLLGILSKQRKDLILKKRESNTLGVPFGKLYKELNCDQDELSLITSELYTSDEIGFYKVDFTGLFAKNKGATAYSNKKYQRRIIERRKEKIKFFIQTAIPILALVVAILSLSIKFDHLKTKFNEELQNLKKTIKSQELRINKLEMNFKKSSPRATTPSINQLYWTVSQYQNPN